MEPKDLCDKCTHERVCVLSRQLNAIGKQLTKDKDDDIAYIPVRFGVIDCPEYTEAADEST